VTHAQTSDVELLRRLSWVRIEGELIQRCQISNKVFRRAVEKQSVAKVSSLSFQQTESKRSNFYLRLTPFASIRYGAFGSFARGAITMLS
jgi:hypothetical protein